MLSLDLIVGHRQAGDDQPRPYPLDFALLSRLPQRYSRFICTALSISLGTRTIGRCLVSATVAEIKLIYCTSIKQQERSCFRHLKKSMSGIIEHHPSWLCMLTHHLYTLSKPVSPVSGVVL